MSETSGYVYIATGSAHVAEAIASAKRLRQVAPKAEIALVTSDTLDDVQCSAFSSVTHRDGIGEGMQRGFRYVIGALADALPFDRTVFLDTDVWAVSNPNPLFNLCDHVDVAATVEPNGFFEGPVIVDDQPVRAAPRYNTGVVVLRRSDATAAMLHDWARRFDQRFDGDGTHPFETDQRTFSEALLASSCQVAPLESNWNFRTPMFAMLSGPVKILHGRHIDFAQTAEVINSSSLNRAWNPFTNSIEVLEPERVFAMGLHHGASLPSKEPS